jgi:hypothetical protein
MNEPIFNSDTCISRAQLARRWNCSIETIKRRERAGILPAIKFSPRCTRYRVTDVQRVEQDSLTGQEVAHA